MIVKGLVFAVVLFLFGCAHNVEITRPAEAQAVPAASLPTPSPEPPAPPVKPEMEAPVVVLGDFSNRKGDGEHEWGYSVELWKQGDQIHGTICGTNDLRLIGGPPTGLLEDAQYDPKTGRLSFRSKLSLSRVNNDRGSRDIYEFEGVLTANRLTGVVTSIEEVCGNCRNKVKVALRRSKEQGREMEGYKTLEEWRASLEDMLKFRGPRW